MDTGPVSRSQTCRCSAREALGLQILHPRPATVDIHASEVGRRAVEQLLWRLDHPKEPRAAIMLTPELVPHEL